jgi:hypothetical protein
MKNVSPPTLRVATAGRNPRTVQRLTIEHPKSLASIVEERQRAAIANAELRFGQALPEGALALGVSRMPMRDALTRFELQGLSMRRPCWKTRRHPARRRADDDGA